MIAFVTTLYAMSGFIIAGLYVPQIVSLLRSKNGAKDVSILMFAGFTAVQVVALLYALVVSHDERLAIVSGIALAGCAIVTGLAGWKRYRACAFTAPGSLRASRSASDMAVGEAA